MIRLISMMVDNPPLRIYINGIKNIITFKTVTGYYLELLTSETMKFLEALKDKMVKMCLI